MKNFFKYIWNHLTIVVLARTVLWWCRLTAQKARIGKVLYSEAFRSILAQYLNVRHLRKDRIGRLYCVVNPNLNASGVFDINMIIYELDAHGLQYSNQQYIEKWLLDRMRLVQDLFKQRALFSELTFKTSHVGPSNQDNYLIEIAPSYFDDFDISWSSCWKRLVFWGIVGAGCLIAFL